MKKRICLTLIVLINILLASSCGVKKTNTNGAGTSTSVCERSFFINKNNNFAIGPEGYYSLNKIGPNSVLTYIDKKNTDEIYLCSKPECSHVDERGFGLPDCNAFVGCSLPQSLVYHNGYLYVLKFNRDTFDVTLTEISADGSIHRDIMVVGQIAENASYYEYLFVSDTTLLMVYNPPELAGRERTACLEEVNISTKEKRTVYSITGENASLTNFKKLDQTVFFRRTEKKGEEYISKLMRYGCDTAQCDLILEENIGSYTIVDSRQLFYYVNRDGLYRCDLQSMEKSLIKKCDEETMYGILASDGEYVYIENFNNRFFYNEQSKHKLFVCDLDGKVVNTIPAGTHPVVTCDKDYIFAQSAFPEGINWTYIRREDIAKPDVTWSKVNQ